MENFQNFEEFEELQQGRSIDIKALFFKFSHHWYLFAISVFVALIIAFLFNKYTNPIYEVTSTVLVNNKANMEPSALLGLGMGNTQQNVKNEIGRLSSFTLAYRSVRALHFEVSYYEQNGLMTKEIYKAAPFEIVFDSTVPQAVGLRYTLNFLNNNEYEIIAEGEHIQKYNYAKHKFEKKVFDKISYKGKFRFGEEVKLPFNQFKIILNDNFNPGDDLNKSYQFAFNDYISLTKLFMGVKIETIDRDASILKLTLKSPSLDKGVDYLNMLTHQYLEANLETKNKIAENTIAFINKQLRVISDSLKSAEMNLQNFRSKNEVMDLSFQAQQVFQYMNELQKQKASLMVKSQYYNNLRNYIRKNENNPNNLVAPSAMGIDDPALNALVAQLIDLFNKKAEVLLYSTEKSPTVITINSQILSTKKAIIENVSNIIKNSNEAIADIDRRIKNISSKLSSLPITQRELLNYERKFNLADNLYTFLLKKRSDAQITKASNMPDNEIIDKARTDVNSGPVFPKKSLNYLIAFVLGIGFPIVYVLGKDALNEKIVERKDVEHATKFPVIGYLLHSNKDTQLVVPNYPKSSISESFRLLRTNIQFLIKRKTPVTIMITADISGVGKTFTSMNLAAAYAQYGKKTILLGFDFRKPKIYHDFHLNNDKGITSYLIGKNTLDEVIQHTDVVEHLDILLAGPVPPNPAELIASDKTTRLFEELKKRYDYIIIDTPPAGLVADAFLLMPYTDVNIFLVRQNYTNKRVFASLIRDIESRGMKMNIVVNDIDMENSYGYGYGYGYVYGYGYSYGYGNQGNGYYTDDKPEKKDSFFRRLINKV